MTILVAASTIDLWALYSSSTLQYSFQGNYNEVSVTNSSLIYQDGDESIWDKMISSSSNYKCDNSSHHDNQPTSIHATILASNVTTSITYKTAYIEMDIVFYAYTKSMQAQKFGGDEFVIDYQSYWPSSSVPLKFMMTKYNVIRSSAFSIDHNDGTYHARLHLPLHSGYRPHQHVRISIRHYYTCYEGLKLPFQLSNQQSYNKLTFGPLPWEKLEVDIKAKLSSISPAMKEKNMKRLHLPMCSEIINKQSRIDNMLHGYWFEKRRGPPPLRPTPRS